MIIAIPIIALFMLLLLWLALKQWPRYEEKSRNFFYTNDEHGIGLAIFRLGMKLIYNWSAPKIGSVYVPILALVYVWRVKSDDFSGASSWAIIFGIPAFLVFFLIVAGALWAFGQIMIAEALEPKRNHIAMRLILATEGHNPIVQLWSRIQRKRRM